MFTEVYGNSRYASVAQGCGVGHVTHHTKMLMFDLWILYGMRFKIVAWACIPTSALNNTIYPMVDVLSAYMHLCPLQLHANFTPFSNPTSSTM